MIDLILIGAALLLAGGTAGFFCGMQHGIDLCKLNHPKEGSDLGVMRYGYNKTWHRTHQINVETHEGRVVAVWFRCMALPYTVSNWGAARARDMDLMYADKDGPHSFKIHAVDVELPKEDDYVPTV